MLRLVFTLGWLPALVTAYLLRTGNGPPVALSGAGARGAAACAGLAATLAVLSAGYFAALRRPPQRGELLTAAAGSVLAALAMPLLFSADVYAYAYYGDLALRGQNPYGHGPPPAADPLAAAAVAAWAGKVPPRCVYGPAAVGLAALIDAAGAGGGVAVQIALQRLAAAAAYAFYTAIVLRLVRAPRTRAALLLNPVVLWSVAEGHNDTAMTALAAAGLAATRARPLWFAAAALVKAIALVMWTKLENTRDRLSAGAAVAAGYVPLLVAWLPSRSSAPAAGDHTALWASPLGLAATLAGREFALALALAALIAAAVGARRLPAADRAPAFALAAWFALPNAYPWYALWIVPLAARRLSSKWSAALLTCALFAPARVVTDAVFGASESLDAAPSLLLGMIALAYLPPLAVLAVAGRFRRRIAALAAVAALVTCRPAAVTAQQTSAPSPMPAAAPATPAGSPSPAAGPAPSQPLPAAVPQSPPLASPQAPPSPIASAQPLASPSAAPSPSAPSPAPVASAVPSPNLGPTAGAPGPPAPIPAPVVTANPFGYIINPPPVPATLPDGPHILQVDLNDRRIRAGGPLLVRVFTSANVVGVEARALGRFIPIPQSSPGLFALAYTMPLGIPFWLLNRNYDIVIAAATADGRQTSVSFPMLLTR